MKNYVLSAFCWMRRKAFCKRFLAIGASSGFGTYGYGNTCIIKGAERIRMEEHSWFGNQSEVIVYSQSNGVQTNSLLTIGDGVSCTSRCRITCAGHITIDNDVLIAPDVFITDHNHGMHPNTSGGYKAQPLIVKDVHIEDGVWLGQRVCVLPGVTIGAQSIIGANSVVTHDIPPYSIAVGSPARVVKQWNAETESWDPVQR